MLCLLQVLLVVSIVFKTQAARLSDNKLERNPSENLPINVVTSIPAFAEIQIKRTKPKNVEKILTTIEDIIVKDTEIQLKWKILVNTTSKVEPTRRRRSHSAVAQVSQEIPAEWIIKIRQFGTRNVKTKHIYDQIDYKSANFSGFKWYNLTLSNLLPNTPYEVCVQSRDFPIEDQTTKVPSSTPIMSTKIFTSNGIQYSKCKEITTLMSIDSGLNKAEVAVVTAVSSASTMIIVFVLCCWCPSKKKRKNKEGVNYRKVSYRTDKSSNSSSYFEGSVSSDRNYTFIDENGNCIHPNKMFYIDRRKAKVFVKPQSIPSRRYEASVRSSENDRQSPRAIFHARYYRCRSWPYCSSSTQENSESLTSTESGPNNSFWYHSPASTLNTRL